MDQTLQLFDRVLSNAGVSIFAKTNWDTKPWLIFQILNFFGGFFCFIFTTGFVVTNTADLLVFIKGACIWATGIIMTISLAVCLAFRRNFRNFLEEMIYVDPLLDMPLVKHVLSEEVGVKSNELRHLVNDTQEKLFKYTQILLKCYVFCGIFVATLYLCSPIYEMIIRNDKSLRLFAFDMWFPWELDNLYVYIATFIYHVYAGNLCCIAYPGLQSMIILLVGQQIRHLKVLTFIILNLDELVTEYLKQKNERWQPCCTAVLVDCVDHYVKLKRFGNRLNIICRPFYLTLILVSIVIACMCSVKIAVSDKLSPDTMKYYTHIFIFIVVVLIFCLLGQQVENQCEILEISVTEKWYIYDREYKLNMQIFNNALSQRMPIYIFGTVTLSLPTFTWFIKTGMSFFTLVMSVIKD